MAIDIYLYPGVDMNVTAPTKVTMTPLAPGEVPPAGATIIPPQSQSAALTHALRTGAMANLAVANQGAVAAQELTNQQTVEAQQAFDAALAASNKAAADLTQAAQAKPTPPPPWSVTFTEKQ